MLVDNAAKFVKELKALRSDNEREKIARYLESDDDDNQIIGVRMKQVFDLSKASTDLPLEEIERLLESPYYEARMGAVSIMDFQARRKSTDEAQRKKLFDLYLNRHDRINNWDLVDRTAKRVIGGYLFEFGKPPDVLFELAQSEDFWKRRTAIVATSYFIREGELGKV